MKIGDLAEVCLDTGDLYPRPAYGLIVGFNKKGLGGKEYVHLYVNGNCEVFLKFEIKLV